MQNDDEFKLYSRLISHKLLENWFEPMYSWMLAAMLVFDAGTTNIWYTTVETSPSLRFRLSCALFAVVCESTCIVDSQIYGTRYGTGTG